MANTPREHGFFRNRLNERPPARFPFKNPLCAAGCAERRRSFAGFRRSSIDCGCMYTDVAENAETDVVVTYDRNFRTETITRRRPRSGPYLTRPEGANGKSNRFGGSSPELFLTEHDLPRANIARGVRSEREPAGSRPRLLYARVFTGYRSGCPNRRNRRVPASRPNVGRARGRTERRFAATNDRPCENL